MKTEPDVFSIDRLKQMKRAPWDGVRNFQARNFMKNDMKVGDLILFYHSSTEPPGVAGLARVAKEAFPDYTSWDKKSSYYDPRSSKEKPLWFMVEVEFVEKFPHYVTLDEIRGNPRLQKMMVIRRGMRLSIQPVSEADFNMIAKAGRGGV
jgi:predicted RNA-binding protein with PUA-like domain